MKIEANKGSYGILIKSYAKLFQFLGKLVEQSFFLGQALFSPHIGMTNHGLITIILHN